MTEISFLGYIINAEVKKSWFPRIFVKPKMMKVKVSQYGFVWSDMILRDNKSLSDSQNV